MAEPHGVSVELEHAIGFRGGLPNSLFLLPGGEEAVHVSGACVVIASLADPHQQTFLRGHTEPISCLHVSPDGRLAASGQRGRVADVIVWDLARRCELYRLQEHDAKIDGGISNAAFSEDGRFLLTVGLVPEDKKMVVWDMSSGCIVASVERGVPTACVAFGGRVKDVKRRPTTHPQFVSAGDDGLKFWDLDPARGALSSVPCNTLAQVRSYSCVAFSANEDVFFAGTLTGDFCVLNAPRRLSSGELERVQLRLSVLVCSGGVHCMRVGGAGLYVGGGDGTVTLYDTADEGFKPRRLAAGLAGAVTSVALSAERGVALYGTTAAAIYEHALGGEGGPPRAVALSHGARVVGVAYAPGDSVRFATASHDLSVRVWSASDYSVEMEVSSRNCGLPLCVAFSGAAVFVGWEDGKIRAYDADEAAELWAIDNCHRGGVTALALSANGRFVCSGGARGEVRVWELKSRMLASHLVQHDDAVTSLAISDDDLLLYSSSRDKTFVCWDLRQEKRLATHAQGAGGINALVLLPAPSPDVRLLSVGQERKLTEWDVRQADAVRALPAGREQLCLCASADSGLVAAGGVDSVVRLYDAATLALLAECVGHSDHVLSLRFSPDGRQLVSAGADGCVLVWNVYT